MRVPDGAPSVSRSYIHDNVMATRIRPHPKVVQNTALTPPIRRETISYIECHTSPLSAPPVLWALSRCNSFDVSNVFWLFFQANIILINHPRRPSLAKSDW